MKHYRFVTWLFVLCIVLGFAQQASAQQWELYGYGGGIFPGNYREQFDLKKQATWGAKLLGYASDRLGIEGNFGYISQFEFENTDPKSRGLIWEINTNLNFFGARGSVAEFAPYVTVGVGGITALVPDENPLFGGAERVVILPANHPKPPDGEPTTPTEPEPPIVPDPTPDLPPPVSPSALILDDGDTFFAVNYGGGLKRNKAIGPMGFRIDFLGRSMPNFFNNSLTWFEVTGGVNFSWGER